MDRKYLRNPQVDKLDRTLERKHSSGDLHSRLKTRKLLGVGETDDGNVHRSKLSQILGHSEQLYVKLPRGLRAWQCFTTAIFITLAVWAFVFPANFYSRLTSGPTSHSATSVLPLRLYAVAMMSFAVFSYSNYRCTDRDSIRISMLSGIVYFSLHSLVVLTDSENRFNDFNTACLLVNAAVILLGQLFVSRLNQGYQPSTTTTAAAAAAVTTTATECSQTEQVVTCKDKKYL